MERVENVQGLIKVQHVLLSVANKDRLSDLVKRLLSVNQGTIFYSTTGTYKKIKEILGFELENSLIEIAAYTGYPEFGDGLVKTLHPKVHAGLLVERMNVPLNEELVEMGAVPFDLMVGNLYPFEEVIATEGTDPEDARKNIDIGGPTMLRAGAKNWHGCAVLVDLDDYDRFFEELASNDGATSLRFRYSLYQKVFTHTAKYEAAIAKYVNETSFEDAKKPYTIHY